MSDRVEMDGTPVLVVAGDGGRALGALGAKWALVRYGNEDTHTVGGMAM
jgi:hypothetical protein